MPGTQRVRGKVNVVLNRLVREGVIRGFRTNFDFLDGTDTTRVVVSVPEEWSLDAAQLLVVDALSDVIVGIDVTAVRDLPA